jgi:hypothetical protein
VGLGVPNTGAVVVINVFRGSPFSGWVMRLAMAARRKTTVRVGGRSVRLNGRCRISAGRDAVPQGWS